MFSALAITKFIWTKSRFGRRPFSASGWTSIPLTESWGKSITNAAWIWPARPFSPEDVIPERKIWVLRISIVGISLITKIWYHKKQKWLWYLSSSEKFEVRKAKARYWAKVIDRLAKKKVRFRKVK